MSRNYTCQALTLRVKASGESNREAWFLTAEQGLLKATVYGGPKSRLRAYVAPFHAGKLWIYHDPVKDSNKVSDFDVQSYRPGIRELWERTMAADAMAEPILSFQGGGESWPLALRLAGAVLDALNEAAAGVCPRLAVYFFWHWASLLGVKPELSACASCSCEARREDVLWYFARKEALFCEKCSIEGAGKGNTDSLLRLGGGARLWLKEIESLPPAAVERVTLDNPSLEQAKAISQAVLAAALGKRLPTWNGI
jgi:DNA repair protein RecO (recombination protein O)